MGPRQYSQHTFHRAFRVANFFYVMLYHLAGTMRPIFSRMFLGVSSGPLNYSGMLIYVWFTAFIIAKFKFTRSADVAQFNAQDNPEFWYARYNMMFPPSFLHNRISAHYIEINHIFAIEMMKRYQVARKEVLSERERHSDFDRRTKYISNPNYIYEPLGADDDKIKRLKADGLF